MVYMVEMGVGGCLLIQVLIFRINVLQKAIFKAKNTGNSLKIALPFENILDMELTEAFEFQQFLQIRAVGIDDSFVMDEVWINILISVIIVDLTTCFSTTLLISQTPMQPLRH